MTPMPATRSAHVSGRCCYDAASKPAELSSRRRIGDAPFPAGPGRGTETKPRRDPGRWGASGRRGASVGGAAAGGAAPGRCDARERGQRAGDDPAGDAGALALLHLPRWAVPRGGWGALVRAYRSGSEARVGGAFLRSVAGCVAGVDFAGAESNGGPRTRGAATGAADERGGGAAGRSERGQAERWGGEGEADC